MIMDMHDRLAQLEIYAPEPAEVRRDIAAHQARTRRRTRLLSTVGVAAAVCAIAAGTILITNRPSTSQPSVAGGGQGTAATSSGISTGNSEPPASGKVAPPLNPCGHAWDSYPALTDLHISTKLGSAADELELTNNGTSAVENVRTVGFGYLIADGKVAYGTITPAVGTKDLTIEPNASLEVLVSRDARADIDAGSGCSTSKPKLGDQYYVGGLIYITVNGVPALYRTELYLATIEKSGPSVMESSSPSGTVGSK